MKKEIRILRKCQKILWDLQYPGYPFQMSVVIDIADYKAWVDYGKVQDLNRALISISQPLLYQAVNCDLMTKRTFLQDQNLSTVDEILKADYNQFYIDNYNAVRFYLALMSAIYKHKKNEKAFIFACIDDDTDWVDVKVFTTLEEIKKYHHDYFKSEED